MPQANIRGRSPYLIQYSAGAARFDHRFPMDQTGLPVLKAALPAPSPEGSLRCVEMVALTGITKCRQSVERCHLATDERLRVSAIWLAKAGERLRLREARLFETDERIRQSKDSLALAEVGLQEIAKLLGRKR